MQTGFKWPESVIDHLASLLKTVRHEGNQDTTLQELTAAIIALTAPDSAQLSELLTQYRQLTMDRLATNLAEPLLPTQDEQLLIAKNIKM